MSEQIDAWSRLGLIRRTGGDVVDYHQVAQDVVALLEPYRLVRLAVDQGFQGMQITQDFQRMFEELVVAYKQGLVDMAAPFRELIEMVKNNMLQ